MTYENDGSTVAARFSLWIVNILRGANVVSPGISGMAFVVIVTGG